MPQIINPNQNKQQNYDPTKQKTYAQQAKERYQQRHDHSKGYRLMIKGGGWLAAILLLCVGGYAWNQYKYYKNEDSGYEERLSTYSNKDQKLVADSKKPKYVVNAQGHMDYNAQRTITKIDDLFNVICTWDKASGTKTGHSYSADVDYAHNLVKDPKFFKTFMKPMIDHSGDSIISNMHFKRLFNDDKIYEISPGKYLVIVSYYDYFSKPELKEKDSMTPTTKVFLFEGDSDRISYARPIKNLETSSN